MYNDAKVRNPGSRGGHIIGHTRSGNPIYGTGRHGGIVHNHSKIKSATSGEPVTNHQEHDHIYVVQNPTRKGWIQAVSTALKANEDLGFEEPQIKWLRHGGQLVVWAGPVSHETIAQHIGATKNAVAGSADAEINRTFISGFNRTSDTFKDAESEDLAWVKSKLNKIVKTE